MAVRKPMVMVDGQLQRLAAGDTVEGASAALDYTATNANAGAITLGMAVYTSAAGAVDLAQADSIGTARVLGLVSAASIAAGASGKVQYAGILASADWTAVTGSATLAAGQNYYLSAATAGQLTSTAPDATGQQLAYVGRAISTTELALEIARPIGL